MFFLMPLVPVLWVMALYVLAAVLPAVFLLRYIYRRDTIEPEPPNLIWALLGCGVLAALCAIVPEIVGQNLLSLLVDAGSPVYSILTAFLVVAAVEEGTKFFFLKRRTWNDPNFNYRFDGIVYAVCVSLGFAAFENIKYVFSFGLSVALPRALLAVPGHMGFAVFMGSFYGRAKLCEAYGDTGGKQVNLWLGYLLAVFLHGFYDACAMIGSRLSTTVFLVFVVVMYILVIRRVRRESDTDSPV